MPAIATPKDSKSQYTRQLQAAILRHGLYRGDVHADSVVNVLPVPDGIHPNTVGSAFAGLEAARLIEAVGFERSSRRRRHRGVSRLWRICDQTGARRYLSALAATGDDVGNYQQEE